MKRTPMHFFEALSAIPRTSGNESASADFVEALAKEHGYFCRRDALNNVVVVKPSSPGMENAETFMLQGHLDMVGEAVAGSSHDFAKDPIRLIREGDVIRADGTTLGADNGIAIAYMLAVMDDRDLRHPRLELVFTSQEEIGLIGASALDASDLKATRMLNMDGGPEGTYFVSCAGGTYVGVERELESEPARGNIYRIEIDGLTSGHSGLAINLERANAIVLCGIFADALRRVGGRLVSIEGGDKDNVIPASATILIAVENDPEKLLTTLRDNMLKNWEVADPGMTIDWKTASSDR
ncbi:MAG: M20/M25/M40 family metallo-hydrolase, partial [Oscillospiraceae bacterium]|nr:M20/M25/M40 family metallo-hydrolase [Oscillospiraceae bacterium]